jgi:hypothetical protein
MISTRVRADVKRQAEYQTIDELDIIDLLARRADYVMTSDVCHIKNLFIGAHVLGDESMKWPHGWWRRMKVPVPIVVIHPHTTKQLDAEQLAVATLRRLDAMEASRGTLYRHKMQSLDRAYERNRKVPPPARYPHRLDHYAGWRWAFIASAQLFMGNIHPSLYEERGRHVNDTTRHGHKILRWQEPKRVLAITASEMFQTILPRLRPMLEDGLGVRFIRKTTDIEHGVRKFDGAWYRALVALHQWMGRNGVDRWSCWEPVERPSRSYAGAPNEA